MLSKNRIKLIKSLDDKKIRQQESLFLAEGVKNSERLPPLLCLRTVGCNPGMVLRARIQKAECKRENRSLSRKRSVVPVCSNRRRRYLPFSVSPPFPYPTNRYSNTNSRLRSTKYRIPATSAQSYASPTGLASPTSSVRPTLPISIIPKWYKPQWVPSRESPFTIFRCNLFWQT